MASLDKWFIFGKDPVLDEGLRAFQAGSFADGAIALEKFIESQTLETSLKRTAKIYLAECYAKMGEESLATGEREDAIAILNLATRIQPNFADLRFKLARAYDASGRTTDALEEIQAALKLNPDFIEAKILMAIVQYRDDACGEAMGCLIDAIAEHSELENEDFQEFCVLHNSGKNEEALERLEGMLGSESDLGRAMIRQAADLEAEGKTQESADLYSRLIQDFPHYADVRYGYSKVLFRLGDKSAALSEADAALVQNPKYADALAFRGVILRSQGDESSAIFAFQSALAVNPEHPIALLEISRRK